MSGTTAPRPLAGADIVAALTAGAGTKLPASVLPAVSSGAALTITNTYTASGPIAPADRLAVVNAPAAVTMTLANGTVDGQTMTIKRFGAGAVTLTLTLDGAAATSLTLNTSAVPRESVTLIWATPLTTWLLT